MTTTRAKTLRATPTPAEVRMWRLLYPLRTNGFHFRKQAPIGPYVVDFACHHARLVIEVDGDSHFSDDAERRDGKRDDRLRRDGYLVLRFTNADVLHGTEGVFSVVTAALEERASGPGAARGDDVAPP